MRKTFFLSVMLATMVYPSCVFANTSLSRDKDDNGNTTLSIHFDNKEAKEIYKHLEYAQGLGGYIVSDNGMGKTHLSSPAISCTKSNPDLLDRKPNDDSPDLYACEITIGTHGLKQNP